MSVRSATSPSSQLPARWDLSALPTIPVPSYPSMGNRVQEGRRFPELCPPRGKRVETRTLEMPSEQPRANSVKSQRGSGRQHSRHPSATPQKGFRPISDRFRTDPSPTKCGGDPNFISNLRVITDRPLSDKMPRGSKPLLLHACTCIMFSGGCVPGVPRPPGGFPPCCRKCFTSYYF